MYCVLYIISVEGFYTIQYKKKHLHSALIYQGYLMRPLTSNTFIKDIYKLHQLSLSPVVLSADLTVVT